MAYHFVMGTDVSKYLHHACVLARRAITSCPHASTNTKAHLRQLFGTYLANDTSVLSLSISPTTSTG